MSANSEKVSPRYLLAKQNAIYTWALIALPSFKVGPVDGRIKKKEKGKRKSTHASLFGLMLDAECNQHRSEGKK